MGISRTLLRTGLCAIAVALIGCQARTPSASDDAGAKPVRAADVKGSGATPAQFDFYVLNLSWSPEYCARRPGAVECSLRRGFIVHGLWPQNSDGTYPELCESRPGPTEPAGWPEIMPDPELVRHEWSDHGTCTQYDGDTYMSVIKKTFQTVKMPAAVVSNTQEVQMSPTAIVDAFSAANPQFPAGGIALSCGNNRLTAVEFCLSKDLKPIACQGLRSCRANVVKITPQ